MAEKDASPKYTIKELKTDINSIAKKIKAIEIDNFHTYYDLYDKAYNTFYKKLYKVGEEKGFRFTIMFAYIDEGGNLNPPKVILSNKKIQFSFNVEPLGEIPLSVLIKYLAMKILLWKICGYPDYTKTLKFEIKE